VRAVAHTFGEGGPNGGFGVWWLCPPHPALAGNACRWALVVKVAILLVGESVSAAARRLSWPVTVLRRR